jgi:hypothetical protein
LVLIQVLAWRMLFGMPNCTRRVIAGAPAAASESFSSSTPEPCHDESGTAETIAAENLERLLEWFKPSPESPPEKRRR